MIGISELFDALRGGSRIALARAMTLVESARVEDRAAAMELLDLAFAFAGKAHRLGITGAPGVGKSTFIERLGSFLIERQHRVAVLAVDPSSERSGGSILGDKTRMPFLSSDRRAFVRPSPHSGARGGVARMTRESMLLAEAAGYDVVIVETVGVGQSETIVSQMVDLFVPLMMPGAGDELQGMKKGVLELADMIVVNKADGAFLTQAELAVRNYANALALIEPAGDGWRPPVMAVSALDGVGFADFWDQVTAHRRLLEKTGRLDRRRQAQSLGWFRFALHEQLTQGLLARARIQAEIVRLETEILNGRSSPYSAAFVLSDKIMAALEPSTDP